MPEVNPLDEFYDWDRIRGNMAKAVTLVVGGAQGTGKYAAHQLLQLGCSVAIADINAKRLEATAKEFVAAFGNDKVLAIPTDATKTDQVQALIDGIVKKFDRLNNIVYCAGAVRHQRPSLEVDSDEWDLIVDSNLKGAFLVEKAAIPVIIRSGGGSIVNMSSRAGRLSSLFLGIHYTVAKTGVLGLSRHIATEFGPKGIRCNSICPGGIVGERMDYLMSMLPTGKEGFEKLANQSPLRRNTHERDVTGAILFLLSELSGFITGAVIDVNGGTLNN
jgi:NAD(P)-dependent dehydrogenase (short-subunit alcohol dehydrogenase family)